MGAVDQDIGVEGTGSDGRRAELLTGVDGRDAGVFLMRADDDGRPVGEGQDQSPWIADVALIVLVAFIERRGELVGRADIAIAVEGKEYQASIR